MAIQLTLEFHDVPEDLENVTGSIYVEDQSEADAPSRELFSGRLGPFMIRCSDPTVRIELDMTSPNEKIESALIIRAQANTRAKQVLEFLNTTTTYLPDDPNGNVRVPMQRIR